MFPSVWVGISGRAQGLPSSMVKVSMGCLPKLKISCSRSHGVRMCVEPKDNQKGKILRQQITKPLSGLFRNDVVGMRALVWTLTDDDLTGFISKGDFISTAHL